MIKSKRIFFLPHMGEEIHFVYEAFESNYFASIVPQVDTLIGAGACVTKSVSSGKTLAGIPTRINKMKETVCLNQ
ncbi:hypothetical protein GMMP15_1040011 [Candidatus Magnetomoraceae bacterium gMMP-15]